MKAKKLQGLLKVKSDLSQVLIFQLGILNVFFYKRTGSMQYIWSNIQLRSIEKK